MGRIKPVKIDSAGQGPTALTLSVPGDLVGRGLLYSGVDQGLHQLTGNRENLQEHMAWFIHDILNIGDGVEGVGMILQQPGRGE